MHQQIDHNRTGQLFTDRLTNICNSESIQPEVKQKKVADFSKMLGRETISSLRKGQHMNKILMNNSASCKEKMHEKSTTQCTSPRKQSGIKTSRLSTTYEQFLSTQQSWKAENKYGVKGRLKSAKVTTLKTTRQAPTQQS